ncbi:gamma-glutamylcyclotransferase-like [Microplitis mediator]|uniref:gamma-glutamylcyclotransferase-like n=1 Tax=Microplitis mediator TaxID=375433 RepID=UPI00255701E8|nr:gamma-glutamylcyclotransferase-like [Microplitis mediator]
MNASMIMMETFLYFAYGSNMLSSRLLVANPTARYRDIACLQDYRLDFCGHTPVWKASPATIVETLGSHIWGVMWELNVSDIKHLDRQEDVLAGIYKPLTVNVTTVDGKIFSCRTYKMTVDPEDNVPLDKLPDHRRPSLIYLKTIIKGAQEHDLPKKYIENLNSTRHNGQEYPVPIGFEGFNDTWN